jgi:putative transposase
LRLSKIGDIKIILHRSIQGSIKTLNISRTSTGKWFANFSCEIEVPASTPSIDKSVGIDLGLSTFATMSDGSIIPRQRFFKQYEKRLAKASRKRETAPKGSKLRRKLRLVESKIHEKVSNIRKDFCHKQAKILVKSFDLICFEDLNIENMQFTDIKNIKKGISDVAWNQFVQFTQYKAESAGKRVVLVDPKNTTKICSRCGSIVPKELSERIHSCSCGLVLDRDLNAAINILRRGLASLAKA